MTESTTPRRARHLMDPNNLPAAKRSSSMSLDRVQKWVMSVLAATTIVHLSAGLVLAAIFIHTEKLGPRIGLNVLAGAFGVIAVAAARGIHQKKLFSPWLLLGIVPTFIGLFLTFR